MNVSVVTCSYDDRNESGRNGVRSVVRSMSVRECGEGDVRI